MNQKERLHLEKMIQANDVENNTGKIRELKHSKLIYEDVNKILNLKKNYGRLEKSNSESFDRMCESQCSFLFNNYTDLYNKVKKNEIDLNMLLQFINVLSKIENGQLDQHEGSYEIGKLLKHIYIDSALKKSEHIDEKYNKNKKVEKRPKEINISWKEYKEKHLS